MPRKISKPDLPTDPDDRFAWIDPEPCGEDCQGWCHAGTATCDPDEERR